MQSLRLSRTSSKFVAKSKNRSELGIVTLGLSLLAAEEIAEHKSRTHLDGHAVASLRERSRLAEGAFFEYLTMPLGTGEILQEKFRELTRVGTDDVDSAEKQPSWRRKASFPSLQTRLLTGQHNDKEEAFHISADEPIKINNELFEGEVMLVLRPISPDDDPDFEQRILEDGATFLIQFQGRFKKKISKDHLFVGAQLGGDMNLGCLAKKASRFILGLLSKNMGSNIRYSFGTDAELPHISFPLHTGMDTVVVSNDLSGSPKIGTLFTKSEEAKSYSKDWGVEGIYSMSYHAKSIDLAAWKILLPFEMNLSTFWGESPLRLVVYEEKSEGEGKEYLFNLQLEHLPTSTSGVRIGTVVKRAI